MIQTWINLIAFINVNFFNGFYELIEFFFTFLMNKLRPFVIFWHEKLHYSLTYQLFFR